MSMFKGKTGFVIPKNKFSGSLVPIFKGAKKSESDDAAIEESSRQLQRKTKWGPDLTQDSFVKKGRALAYQTRVDQITEQLKSGSLRSDSQNSKSDKDGPDSELPSVQIEFKLHTLKLERREAIGEILKLNPNYKAPADYLPVVREATVPIPVKAHPDYNFVGLVYGSDGETQKRLEKETGTRIQVCGTMPETKEKVEITASDGIELINACVEVHVRISSDTYEKVDAAAALIELLLNSVSVKPSVSTTSASISGDDALGLNGAQDIATTLASSTAMANQELQQGAGPISTSSLGPFLSFPSSWLPAGQSSSPSGLAPLPGSMAFSFNPSLTRPSLGPGPLAPYGFGSAHQSVAVPTPRLHTSAPAMPGSFMPQPLGQTGHLSAAIPPTSSLLSSHQPSLAGSPQVPTPQLAERPFMANPPGWVVSPAAAQQSPSSGGFSAISGLPTTQFPSPQLGPGSAISFLPSQMRSSSPLSAQSIGLAPQAQLLRPSTNNALRVAQNPLLPSSATQPPSFTPLKNVGLTASGPTLPGPGDFTFRPHRPQGLPLQSLHGTGSHVASQRPASVSLPTAPQGLSFGPALQNTIRQPNRQNFPGPPSGNLMGPRPGQFGHPNQNPHMGLRHLGPVPNAGGPFPPRLAHSARFQQSYPAPSLGRPEGNFPTNLPPRPSGRPQVYDPFAPTSLSAAQPQGSNSGITGKQETDPEYEDLMASVGVK